MSDIVVLRCKSGEYDGFTQTDPSTIWVARFENGEALLRAARKLSGIDGDQMEDLQLFVARKLYPEHLAGAISGVALSAEELRSVGFAPFSRQTSN